MKRTHRIIGWMAGFIGAVGMAGAVSAATNFIVASNFSFSPSDLTISVGDTVVFSNSGGNHTVTGDAPAEPFCGSASLTTCSVTFTNEGTFAYHCNPHVSLGMTGLVHVVSGMTSPLTIAIHGQGTVTPNFDGQALLIGNDYTVTATPARGFTFVNWTGGVTSSTARLTFTMQPNLVLEANFADAVKPLVTITAPLANARLTNHTVTLSGTASDNDVVETVEYRVESAAGTNDFQIASGTTNWSVELSNLDPGAYRFRVRARDATGNVSTEAIRSVVLLAELTVSTNGNGMVSGGFLGTSFREAGRRLSILAIPKPGSLFSGWSGSIESITNPLVFVMRSDMTLQANFVPNPFLPLKGAFNGLFFIDDPTVMVRHESSGFFRFTLTDRGRYSGQLQLGGRRYPFSGQFSLDGKATNNVRRAGATPLTMELMLDLEGASDRVMGRVGDVTARWTAGLVGDRAPVYVGANASPHQGKYTLLIEPGEEASGFEAGDGFGTVLVNAKGRLAFHGTLADGTPVTQSTAVSKDGFWPLYVVLYGGKGSILSGVTLSTNAASAASLYGDLSWIKPALPGTKYYPAGFTNTFDLEGSIYVPPGTNKVLQIDMGMVTFDGGNLSGSFTNLVTLGANNKVSNQTLNQPLVLNLTLPTGLFNGSVTVMDDGVARKLLFKGALLQRQNLGAGFFLGTDQSGKVLF